MQRGSDRLSRRQDDEMKHQLQGLLRSGHPTRTEEWHDPEPFAEDDPEVASGPVPRPGSTGASEGLRLELGRHLGRTPFPAHRRELLRTLTDRHAPDRLLDLVAELPPDRTYRTVQDVVRALPEK
ncbi:DUF2795 domain-containing protein [Streptomyces sp. A3M-1-3]|nr:DUF2795 domain-containing protein [Streptomyces sp. A3M-1-3]MCP3819106.1 DUF2795 domain-containing protein [Streptomyces sp. A3M-1-3]